MLFLLVLNLLFSGQTARQEARKGHDKPYDLIITGGQVIDGSGNPAFAADVGIKADRIAKISKEKLNEKDTAEVLNIHGKVLSPGFIDNHAHVEKAIHDHPFAENFIRQGITTILASLHSGDQPWPLEQYASTLQMAPNVGFFAGHNWIRKQVLGLENRAPTAEELDRMRSYVEQSMKQGALGFSTGLEYVPGNYSKTEEIIELAKVASRFGGIYVTHMRNEGSGLLDSVRETLRIATEADIPVQINHLKAAGVGQWGSSKDVLAIIDSERAAGIDITYDLYPYTAFSTVSSILIPPWALAGGSKMFAERVADPAQRAKIEREMMDIFQKDNTGDDLSRIQFRELTPDPSYNGKTLADYVKDHRLPNTLQTGIHLVIEFELNGGFTGIFYAMDETDVIRFMQNPAAMFDTDGDLVSPGEGYPHPRSYGAFPRVLSLYVRQLRVLSLEEAIRKMTSLPADQINQKQRGRIKEGAYADLVVFDPQTIQDHSGFNDPHHYPTGIDHVMINGKFVIKSGILTGNKPGKWIRGPARSK